MQWFIGEARQKFSELISDARERGPQEIIRGGWRKRLVAIVIGYPVQTQALPGGGAVLDDETYREFEQWRTHQQQSLAEATAEIRALAALYDWELEVPERVDRPNAFVEMLESEYPEAADGAK